METHFPQGPSDRREQHQSVKQRARSFTNPQEQPAHKHGKARKHVVGRPAQSDQASATAGQSRANDHQYARVEAQEKHSADAR